MLNVILSSWVKAFAPNPPDDLSGTLSIYSSYYQQLDRHQQHRFEKRLFLLLQKMEFHPCYLPKVTDEMRIVIGSAIIQLTFGLKQFIPKRFTKVYIVPRAYRFEGRPKPFLGHVDFQKKIVCLSWTDVQKGFLTPNDALNVALHEVAHCLEAESQMTNFSNDFLCNLKWSFWVKEAVDILLRIQNGETCLLKPYAGKNLKEMFAVCMETFFEKPYAFKHQLPTLFKATSILLNQNPVLKGNPVLEHKGL